MRRRIHATAAAAAAAAIALLACDGESDSTIRASGTIEVVEVDVAPTAPARVVAVRVDEGDVVRAGDTVALLTQSDLSASLEGQRAQLRMAEASLRDLRNGARPQEIRRAEAELAAAEAEAARTARDLERIEALVKAEAESQQRLDAARAAAVAAAGARDAAREAVRLLRAGNRPERIRAAEAEVATARAALEVTEAEAGDLVLTAPVSGTVLGRFADPGEVLERGRPVLTIGETSEPWVRIYLAGRDVAHLRVGQPATATIDGVTDREFAGRVQAINPRAEFTPRVALTTEERADLAFGIKIDVADTTGVLKPGLPVTVRIDR